MGYVYLHKIWLSIKSKWGYKKRKRVTKKTKE